jgi:hypothetical protein
MFTCHTAWDPRTAARFKDLIRRHDFAQTLKNGRQPKYAGNFWTRAQKEKRLVTGIRANLYLSIQQLQQSFSPRNPVPSSERPRRRSLKRHRQNGPASRLIDICASRRPPFVLQVQNLGRDRERGSVGALVVDRRGYGTLRVKEHAVELVPHGRGDRLVQMGEVERDVGARLVALGDSAREARCEGHDDVVVVGEDAALAAAVDVLVAVEDDGVGVFDRKVVRGTRESLLVHDFGVGHACYGRLGCDCRSVLQAEVARDRRDGPIIQYLGPGGHDHAVPWLSRASRVLGGRRRRSQNCSSTRATRLAVRLFGIR